MNKNLLISREHVHIKVSDTYTPDKITLNANKASVLMILLSSLKNNILKNNLEYLKQAVYICSTMVRSGKLCSLRTHGYGIKNINYILFS